MKVFLDRSEGKYKFVINSETAAVNLEEKYADSVKAEEGKEVEQADYLNAFADAAADFKHMWDNNGLDRKGTEWSIQDMYSTPDAPWMFPKVVSEQAMEAIEPQLLMTSMMKRIQYTMGQQIILPMNSALADTKLDMAEGDEYQETKLTKGAASLMIANIGKVGLAVKITEEMIRYSQFDVIGMHVTAAGKMLARHKETKAFNMVAGQGVCYYDNMNPKASELGVTHGRDRDGSGNGTLIADDFLDLEGHLVAKGFQANTMILHPLMYTMFRKDPVMRTLFFSGGGTTTYFGTYTGNPMGGNPWVKGASMTRGKQQEIRHDTETDLRNQDINTAPVIPAYWGVNMSILVTPHAKYDPIKKVGDIVLCDKDELGVLLVDEELTTEEWTDPARDIKKIKFRERYCFGILNEGQSVAVMRNIKNGSNKLLDKPAEPHYDAGPVDLTELDARTPVLA